MVRPRPPLSRPRLNSLLSCNKGPCSSNKDWQGLLSMGRILLLGLPFKTSHQVLGYLLGQGLKVQPRLTWQRSSLHPCNNNSNHTSLQTLAPRNKAPSLMLPLHRLSRDCPEQGEVHRAGCRGPLEQDRVVSLSEKVRDTSFRAAIIACFGAL